MDVEEVLAQLIPQVPTNVFSKWLTERVSLIWLEVDDDRLGMTRFEDGPTELVRRRALSLDPGPITIGLHPRLVEEPDLLKHTLAHELVHASCSPPPAARPRRYPRRSSWLPAPSANLECVSFCTSPARRGVHASSRGAASLELQGAVPPLAACLLRKI